MDCISCSDGSVKGTVAESSVSRPDHTAAYKDHTIHAALIACNVKALPHNPHQETQRLLIRTEPCLRLTYAMHELLHLTNLECGKRISALDHDGVSLDASAAAAKVLAQIPPGWSMNYDKYGLVCFVDHNANTTRWTLPWGKDMKLSEMLTTSELVAEEAAKYPQPEEEHSSPSDPVEKSKDRWCVLM